LGIALEIRGQFGNSQSWIQINEYA